MRVGSAFVAIPAKTGGIAAHMAIVLPSAHAAPHGAILRLFNAFLPSQRTSLVAMPAANVDPELCCFALQLHMYAAIAYLSVPSVLDAK